MTASHIKHLAALAFSTGRIIKEAHSMMMLLDGSGFETFNEMDDEHQKALLSGITSALHEADENAALLSIELERLEASQGGAA